jgi:hypothetical protein
MNLKHAMSELDKEFGVGFSKNNPQIVMDYLKADSLSEISKSIITGFDGYATCLNTEINLGSQLEKIGNAIYSIACKLPD